MNRIRRLYRIARARLGLPPPRHPDPCEICGRRSRRNIEIVTVTDTDFTEIPGTGGGGSITATYCRAHKPLTRETPHACP